MIFLTLAALAEAPSFVPARNPCQPGSLEVNLGFDPNGGAVEIMTPKMDTDGKEPYRAVAKPVMCIDPQTLREWFVRAGQISYGTTWEVTYDPAGTPSKMRSQYDYSVLMCEELGEVTEAPADLMLGHFEWSPETGVTALRVKWERDFRGYLERTCIR